MKTTKLLTLLSVASMLIFTACSKEEESVTPAGPGSMVVKFDLKVGSAGLSLVDGTSTTYPYTNAKGQTFNLTTFGFYVCKFKLEGPNGEKYEDEVKVSASEVKGYYQVLADKAETQNITLKNIPAGKYNKITFTIGVPEEGVKEGAAGGILDPAAGAWFWNWNSGYIAFAVEGKSPNAGSADKTLQIHVGGWKDVPAATGQTQKFFNNIKEITLSFDETVTVSDKLTPEPHVVVDVMKVLDGASVDFSTTYAVHSPSAGKTFAEQLNKAFILDHIHQ